MLTTTPQDHWLRGKDLNFRPLGYEPNEIPDCSTPRYVVFALFNNIKCMWDCQQKKRIFVGTESPIGETDPLSQRKNFSGFETLGGKEKSEPGDSDLGQLVEIDGFEPPTPCL